MTDLALEQFKDTLQAKQDNADLGLIEIKLNKHDLVTIDTVNRTITTSGVLSFKEFDCITEVYRGLR